MQLVSILTCPHCRHAEELTMPLNACQFFQVCSGCRALLRPSVGHCCVFCSFGTVQCPPMQGGDREAPGGSCCSPVSLNNVRDDVSGH